MTKVTKDQNVQGPKWPHTPELTVSPCGHQYAHNAQPLFC